MEPVRDTIRRYLKPKVNSCDASTVFQYFYMDVDIYFFKNSEVTKMEVTKFVFYGN